MLKNAAIVPYIPVSDMARARKFYEQKIGLKAKEEYAGGVIYECGKGSWAFMCPSAGAGTSKASTAFWAVDDVAAEVAELKSRGVVFEEYNMPGIKTATRGRFVQFRKSWEVLTLIAGGSSLAKVGIFSGLADDELAFLTQRAVPRRYTTGELVFAGCPIRFIC